MPWKTYTLDHTSYPKAYNRPYPLTLKVPLYFNGIFKRLIQTCKYGVQAVALVLLKCGRKRKRKKLSWDMSLCVSLPLTCLRHVQVGSYPSRSLIEALYILNSAPLNLGAQKTPSPKTPVACQKLSRGPWKGESPLQFTVFSWVVNGLLCVHMSIYIYMYMYMCVYIYVDVCIYIYIRTYTAASKVHCIFCFSYLCMGSALPFLQSRRVSHIEVLIGITVVVCVSPPKIL